MKLYLLRHGIAEELRNGCSDDDRALTKEGGRKTRKALEGLRALGVSGITIFSSPLRRAQETAEIAGRVLNSDPAVMSCGELRPGTSTSELLRWLRTRKEEALMLVGHEPDLGCLAAALLTSDGRLKISLKRAGVCWIETDRTCRRGRSRLCALFPPGSLRLIRGRGGAEKEEA